MNILYISYWGVEDGLTAATVIPHLEVLSAFATVNKIVYCSVERGGKGVSLPLAIQKVTHVPLISTPNKNVLLEKIHDFVAFPRMLKIIVLRHAIDVILCRSAMAGALGHRLSGQTGIPYCVESFEPHADYMVESQVWKWYDARTLIQRRFEAQQKKAAAFLLPVSNNYTTRLRAEGIDPRKLITLPCTVPAKEFSFNAARREATRNKLGLDPHHCVGIYVGKYGGIYHDDPAFVLYRQAFDFFGDAFRLIILSTQHPGGIQEKLARYGIPKEKVFVQGVPHDEVTHYLSAADFAFSTIKPSPSRKYCSPIKNGEYWANGLLILTEDGIGDDSDIIRKEGGGVLLQRNDPNQAFSFIREMLKQGRHALASQIQPLATRHRGEDFVKKAYDQILLTFPK